MKVSIDNFKSIRSLVNYELKPLTIISGVNSSGKSSFIQLLLLIKQTIQQNSSNDQLFLNGDLYRVKDYTDILMRKELSNKLKLAFEFSKEEDLRVNSTNRISIFDSQSFNIRIEIDYDYFDEKEFISRFLIKYLLPQSEKNEQYVKFETKKETNATTFFIDANSLLFGRELWTTEKPLSPSKIEYLSIYPLYYEQSFLEKEPSPKIAGQEIFQKRLERKILDLDGIKDLVNSTFEAIHYVGPIRTEPQDEYVLRKNHTSVGSSGEYVSQVLDNFSQKQINFFRPVYNESGEVSFTSQRVSLLDAVKCWICDVFKVGNDIITEKINDVYIIYLVNDLGIKTTIKHVGFGISQILPIIVEGLLMEASNMLILEQPEIHLHPKIQSLLFDFLYSLTLQDKRIVLETHSDHLITRMRRRVAEDRTNSIAEKINLTFIESQKGEILFRTINVDDLGAMEYFPEDFIEQYTSEMKAILTAQIKKQDNKKDGI